MEDAFSIVLEELEKVEGYKKRTNNGIVICCPFHDEKTPSCGINTSMDSKVPVGTWNCLGCGESGPWNKLAAKMDLRQIKDWQHFKGTSAGTLSRANKRKKDFENTNNHTKERLFEEVGNAVVPWPKEKEWRDYPGSMISRVEGYMYDDMGRDELMLVLPVYINGRYRGGVKALWEKPAKGPSYVNTNGDWILNYGLLGYDFIRKHDLFGCPAVVLVEGPRDWLRLVLNKIPACAILGSKMFSQKKLMLLMGLGIKKIYTLADNDSSGSGMVRIIEEHCKGQIDFEELKLPRKKDSDGKLIKCDPDSADQAIIDKVKKIVCDCPHDEIKLVKKKKIAMPDVPVKKKTKKRKAA